jgi:hypothetical protein
VRGALGSRPDFFGTLAPTLHGWELSPADALASRGAGAFFHITAVDLYRFRDAGIEPCDLRVPGRCIRCMYGIGFYDLGLVSDVGSGFRVSARQLNKFLVTVRVEDPKRARRTQQY